MKRDHLGLLQIWMMSTVVVLFVLYLVLYDDDDDDDDAVIFLCAELSGCIRLLVQN